MIQLRLPRLGRPAHFLLAAACLAPAAFVAGGCGGARGPAAGEFTATPIFSTKERFTRIGRNIDIELKMMNDDIDRALLLRPVSGLTEWNVP